MQALIGQKKVQGQRFLENGTRIPVTLIDCKDNRVISVLTTEKNKYQAVQLGFSMKKKGNRAEVGHAKGAKAEGAPKFLREVRILADEVLPEVGAVLNPSDVFHPGDIVDVSGMSKGKGYAGGVKRHGFHGGPKTHGQSDRHRAPGSIGQGTTPGRVYRGKRMAGKMGNDNVTLQNLKIVDVTNDGVLVIKGLVPGVINNLILISKVGEDKKFVPLWKEKIEEPATEEAKTADSAESSVPLRQSSSEASEPKEEVKVEGSDEQVKEEAPIEASSIEESPAEVKTEAPEEVKEEIAAEGEPKKEEDNAK